MSANAVLSIACVFLSAMLTAVTIVAGAIIRSLVSTISKLRESVTSLETRLQVFDERATTGAQNLVRALSSRLDADEDVLEGLEATTNNLDRRLAVVENGFAGHERWHERQPQH